MIFSCKPSVCFVAKYTYPLDTRLRQQVQALRPLGVPIHVVCVRGPGQPKREQDGNVRVYRVVPYRPKRGFLLYFLEFVEFALLAALRVAVLSARFGPPLVVAHTLPESFVFTAVVPKLFGRPVILDARDLSVDLLHSRWRNHVVLRKAVTPVFRAMEWLSCRFSDRVIAASEGFRGQLTLRAVPPEKTLTIVNSADDSIFKFRERAEYPEITRGARLMYHGTVAERFGVHVAAEAMAGLVKLVPGSVLDVYGRYDAAYRLRLEGLIHGAGLDGSVLLHGMRTLEELYEIMGSVDFGLVPYLSDEFMKLALSTKAFEFAAAGVPIVASRLPPIQSVFPGGAVGFAEPGDAEGLAMTIAGLCRNGLERRRMAREARRAYQDVSGESNAKRFVGLIEEAERTAGENAVRAASL